MKNFQFTIFNLRILATIFFALPIFAYGGTAEVSVQTGQGVVINALEATVVLPVGVKVEQIYTGRSSILLWIKPPVFDEKTHSISFSGIAPGGFSGARPVLSFSGNFTDSDLGRISFDSVRALRNDGNGTEVKVTLSLHTIELMDDVVAPEPFTPVISKSIEVYENRPFVTFLAQDKGTGIDHYDQATTWLWPPSESDWQETQSPVVLSHKMLFQKIYIRAVDKAGNTRVASTATNYHYALYSIGIIMILLCALSLSKRFSRSGS